MYLLLNILTLLAGNYITVKIEISSTPAQTSTSGQEVNSTNTQWAWKQTPQNLLRVLSACLDTTTCKLLGDFGSI